ncbi:galactose mutarotase-like enzyme [Wenyingzhuangia heitensis]|uniref:Galactose mutarotase-like enzyme n=1 Tax=Wenyingzhuangia heitensis TaxID=1487859 RepID=A0ABX0UB34_9FLAO|nr:aldose 1-epimerase family protein [Wenyingzhuangia heitensis]NIJ46034.1 galactose mutarotase-like enzyme [Wenyingzhuangia heitensis]
MSNMYQLKNQFITATFKTKGAELISLIKNTTEYIWSGDATFWNRHTPVLFPIVGALKNDSYIFKEQEYNIKQHGFARNSTFTVVKQSKNTLVFQLTATKDTFTIYPFDFILQIKYTLSSQGLTTKYIITNPAKQDLYFSIGAHPAFACPFEQNQTREEYVLVFDKKETPTSTSIKTGYRNDEKFNVFSNAGSLALTKTIFDNNAIVFNKNPFSEVSFVHQPTQKKYITIQFKNFPYLGIWSATRNSPFICIEPWHGISDHINHNQQLINKEGIIKLTSLTTFNCEYKYTIH